jgi:tetratricopeptide (TPR) repeat protein
LRVATSVLGASQRWDQALETAKEWRRLGTGESMEADLAIAAAQLHLGNTDASSQQIQPYLERALQDPDKFGGVILLRAQGLLATHQPQQAEALLGPLLPKSAAWRSLWLTLAVRSVEDADRANSWLETVTPFMNDNLNERTALAQAWMNVGKRWNKPDFDAKGRKSLEAIVQLPEPPVGALLVWGSLCENSADWAGAEKSYRRVLDRDPVSVVALNNLANVLVNSKGDLEQAKQLITKALGILPNVPAFLDTRAAVQAALKDYTGAVASMKEAQRLEPQNLTWRVNLLSVLIDAGQLPAARTEMQQIETLLASTPTVSVDLRKRYEALRSKLQ